MSPAPPSPHRPHWRSLAFHLLAPICVCSVAFIHDCSLNVIFFVCNVLLVAHLLFSSPPSLFLLSSVTSTLRLPLSFPLLLSSFPTTFLPRLAGCYAGPVARGRSPSADVVPGRSGCRVHRHETAILRTSCLHALCCRSVDTQSGLEDHTFIMR